MVDLSSTDIDFVDLTLLEGENNTQRTLISPTGDQPSQSLGERRAWRPIERFLLRALFQNYNNTNSENLALFNKVASQIISPFLPVSLPTLVRQYQWTIRNDCLHDHRHISEVSERGLLKGVASEADLETLIEHAASSLNIFLDTRKNVSMLSGSKRDHQISTPQRPTLFQKQIRDWVTLTPPEYSARRSFHGGSSSSLSETSPFLSTPKRKCGETSLLTPASSRRYHSQQSIERPVSGAPFNGKSSHIFRAVSPTPIRHPRRQSHRSNVNCDLKIQKRGPVPKYCYKKGIDPPSRHNEGVYDRPHGESQQLRNLKTTTPVEITRLGYRGFSANSQGVNSPEGFRAGAFMNVATPPECPGVQTPVYISEALRHVGYTKEWPTPFVSLTKNPIRAIARACQLGRKSPGFLAVIDMDILQLRTNVQAAGNLGLEPPNVHYDAGGEFLVWGFVPKRAILSVISIDFLSQSRPFTAYDEDILGINMIKASWRAWFIRQALYKKKFQLNHELGVAIGAFVKTWGIQPSHFEAAVSDVTRDWIWKKRGMDWKSIDEFATGVLIGYENGQLEAMRPQIEESTYASLMPPTCSPRSRLLSPQPDEQHLSLNGHVDPMSISPSSSAQSLTLTADSAEQQPMFDDHVDQLLIPRALLPQSLEMSLRINDFSSLPFFYEAEMNYLEARLEDPFTRLPAMYENEM